MPALYRDFSTQAQIDAQYNPSLALPPRADPLAHYLRDAAQARATLRCRLDVPYGPTLAETLDIFHAEAAVAGPAVPVFVFFHGGYWRAFSSKEFSGVALGLAPLGITTVVVNYALCPAVPIDEITHQCRAALAWVLRHIGTHGGDAQRVAIGGHSAGGHLGAMALATPWQADYGLPDNPLAAALLFSGLYDLAPLRYSYLQPMLQLDEGAVRRQSPLRQARPCSTPVWWAWGRAETIEFARQSQAMHAAWQALGNTSTCAAIEGTDHFSVIHGLSDPGSAACQWLAQALGAAGRRAEQPNT